MDKLLNNVHTTFRNENNDTKVIIWDPYKNNYDAAAVVEYCYSLPEITKTYLNYVLEF